MKSTTDTKPTDSHPWASEAVTSEPLAGMIVVDKPVGVTSMDVVRRVRRAAGHRGRAHWVKAGHAGTLDPLASGVVLVCVGKATKAVSGLMNQGKVYEAGVDLSAFTATDDREGELEPVDVDAPPTEAAVREALQDFVGTIRQRPPAYSAIHVQGQRAYRMARRGETVDLPEREVRVDAIDLLRYDWPMLDLRIACGKGTYIRSIARDLGVRLGTGGHLASLRRTAVGPYIVDDAVTLERFDERLTQADLQAV